MIDLNYFCYVNFSGYSQAAQDMIFALDERGDYNIKVTPLPSNKISASQGLSKSRRQKIIELSKRPKTKNQIAVYHCIPNVQQSLSAHNPKATIGYATFETFEPPSNGRSSWVKILNSNSAVICPSWFNNRIFSHAGVQSPIFHIPHCYDPNLYHPKIEPLEHRSPFTFLFFGEWRERKGYKQLIEAWCREFSTGDDVELLIKTNKSKTAQSTVRHIMRRLGFSKKETAPISFEDTIFDEEDLPRFLKSVDCLVSPTLGEGFGLPGLQCMALGVPVVITDFSGVQEYANENTATLLQPAGFILRDCLDNLTQFKHKKWPLITVAEIAKKMRFVYENQAEVKEKAQYANDYVSKRFTYRTVADKFHRMIESIHG